MKRSEGWRGAENWDDKAELPAERIWKSRKNPFSRQGVVTCLAERIPVVNNALQGLHQLANDDAAYERAKRNNPLRLDGRVVGAAEHIPVVNNVIQRLHKNAGKEAELERAKERNPLGHRGYITQAGEHIPVVADAIRCIHIYRGDAEAAERARAYSLRKLVGKNGAITKVAELLPGTNLIAALALELRGDTSEASRALNWLGQVKDAAGADGALAKVAELFPGTDVVAFGLQCSGGHYASALRSICKTRWVDVRSRSTVLVLQGDRVNEWVILDVVSDLDVHPRVYSLAAGLMDVCIHMLDFNRQGERRKKKRKAVGKMFRVRKSAEKAGSIGGDSDNELEMAGAWSSANGKRHDLRSSMQDWKIVKANEMLQDVIASFADQVPEYCGWGIDLANWALRDWRPATVQSKLVMGLTSLLFPNLPYEPPPAHSASARLAKAIQDTIPEVVFEHKQMPVNPEACFVPETGARKNANRTPEFAGTVACVSCAGCWCFGLHTGPLACFAGCLAVASAVHRKVKTNLVTWLNQSNAANWKWMSAPVQPLVRNVRGGASQPWSRAAKEYACSCQTSGKSRGSDFDHHPPTVSQTSVDSHDFPRHSTGAVSASSSSTKGKRKSAGSNEFVGSDSGPEAFAASIPACSSGSPQSQSLQPQGVVFDWSPEVLRAVEGGTKIAEYLIDEFCTLRNPRNWIYPMSWIMSFFEQPLRRFLNDAFDGRTVPLVIPIPIPDGMYSGMQMWLPEIRIMLVLWFRFADRNYVTQVSAAVVDGLIDQVANVVKSQCIPPDLRDQDPRMAGFTAPIDLKFDVALRWVADNRLHVEFNDLSLRLGLPE